VLQDTNVTPLAHLADVVLAGGTFAEKAGCYVNADGRLQYSEAALPPRDGSLPDLDLFAILLQRPGGPVRSGEVLAELAEVVPALGVARGGTVPPSGLVLGAEPPVDGAARPPVFIDSWYVPMGAARGR
jgi:predicted molibdopterin-dependent oxidoreductase YjgC